MTTFANDIATPTPAELQRAADLGVFLHDAAAGRQRVAVLFPGHGSQYPDMGAHLFATDGAARDLLATADQVTRDCGGFAISEQFLTDAGGPSVPERLTTPAAMQCGIFVVSMAMHGALTRRGLRADVYAGHSLGELAALTAAGVLGFADGLRAVHARAAAVAALEGAGAGAMMSVFVPDDDARRAVRRLILRAQAFGPLVEAIENAPGQMVLSGSTEAVDALAADVTSLRLVTKRLSASHAFHSPVLDECARDLTNRLRGLAWRPPRVPVLSSILMDFYTVEDLPHLPQILGRQLVTPFSFRTLLQRLDGEGVGVFVVSGPSAVLTRIVKSNEVRALAVACDRRGARDLNALDDAVVAAAGVAVDAATTASAPTVGGGEPAAGDDVRRRQAAITAVITRHTGYPATVIAAEARLGSGLAIVDEALAAIRAELLDGVISADDWDLVDGRPRDVSISEILGVPAGAPRPPDTVAADMSRSVPLPVSSVARSSSPVSDRARLVALVTGVFAARTGYPVELIEPGLDLEADLGVDSVKRAEVFGVLADELGVGLDGVDLSVLFTVEAIVDAFLAMAPPAGPDDVQPQTSGSQRVPAEATWNGPLGLVGPDAVAIRYVPALVPAPVRGGATRRQLSGGRFMVLSDDGALITTPVVARLLSAGARVAVIAPDQASAEAIRSRLAEAPGLAGVIAVQTGFHHADAMAQACEQARTALGPATGLLDLTTVAVTGPGFEASAEHWGRVVDGAFVGLFTAARQVYADLREAGADATAAVVTRTGGGFGLDLRGDGNPLGGIPDGFIKSLWRELPDCHVRALDFTPAHPRVDLDPDEVARRVVDELSLANPDDGLEIAYIDDQRHVVKVTPVPADVTVPAHQLDSGDTVVFSGGSRGIALECLVELARRTGARIVVLGRTRLDDPHDRPYLEMSDHGYAAAKGDFLRREQQAHPELSPLQLNQRYRRTGNARTLARHLKTRFAGADIVYETCDVTDAASVAAVATRLREEGRVVRGVVHAAGLESFGAVPKKPFDHSREVVRVKGRGLHHLWHAFVGPQLRFFYSFGSISGRFGMDGQVDYTAGSGLLSTTSAYLASSHPDVDVKTLDWTAWAEVGMAENPQVRAVQEERGLAYMSVDEGVAHFLAELSAGAGDTEVLFCGGLGVNEPVGQMSALSADRRTIATPVDPGTGVVLDRVTIPALDGIRVRGTTAEAARRLCDARDLYLRDHLVKGVPTFPGVMHVESMTQAALVLGDADRGFELLDGEFLKFVKAPSGRDVDVVISAEVPIGSSGTTVRCELRSDVRAPNGTLLEAGRLHSRATVRLGGKRDGISFDQSSRRLLEAPGARLDLDRYYAAAAATITFGPTFRYLRAAALDGDVVVGELRVPHRPRLFSDVDSPRLWTAPIVLDNAGRLGLLHAVHTRGTHAVPVRVRGAVVVRPPVPGERLFVRAEVPESSDDGMRLSLQVSDDDHAPVIVVGSIEFVTIARLEGPCDLFR